MIGVASVKVLLKVTDILIILELRHIFWHDIAAIRSQVVWRMRFAVIDNIYL